MPDTTAINALIAANPDATDAEIAALYPAYVRTPRTTRVSYTELGAIIGVPRAIAVQTSLADLMAGDDGEVRAVAKFFETALSGSGIDPQNPQAPTYFAQFVTNNTITTTEAAHVRYVYPAAGTCPTAQDVADERAKAPIRATMDIIRLGYNAATDLCDRRISGTGAQDPTTDEAAAILALKALLNGGL